MATIGSLSIAFSANLRELETGVEEVADLLDDLSDSVEGVSEKIESASKTLKVKAVLDTQGVEKATEDIGKTSASVQVKASTEKLEKDVEAAAEKTKAKKFSIVAEAKDIVRAAAEAAADVKTRFGKGVVLPVRAVVSGVTEAVGAARQVNDAYNVATRSVGEFSGQLLSVGASANGLRNATVFAFGLSNAITAASSAYSDGSDSVSKFFGGLIGISRYAEDQQRLTKAVSEGVGTFAGAAVACAAYRAAMAGVNSATEDLDPKLKAAVRGLAGMALAFAQTEASSRLSAAATKLAADALRSQASPLAAVTAFSKSYSEGMKNLAKASEAATDRQRALVRIQNILEQVFSNARGAVDSFFQPLVSGFTRAREAGDGYVAAVVRGLRGQVQSIGPVRAAIGTLGNAFAPFAAGFSRARNEGTSFFSALDRGFSGQAQSSKLFRSAVGTIGDALKATGASSYFDPLVTGFSRASAAGDGFIAATARGVSAQLNSLAAYRDVRDAVEAAGKSIAEFGGSIIGVNATTKVGRDAFYAIRASLQAVSSTTSQAAAYIGVLRTSFSAAFQALPAGRAVVASLSSAFSELGKTTSGLSGALPGVGAVVKSLAPWMTLASVASGQFSHALEEIAVQMQNVQQMADRFGASTGQMEVLSYAAESARVSMSQLAKATQNFFTNVSKVKIGQLNSESVQEAKFAFDRLGISIDELRNKNPNEVFALVSEELLNVKDPADRAAIAFDIFGKQAVNVLPALKGLKEAAADSKRLGLETSKVNFDRFMKAEESFDRVSAASKSLGTSMLAAFAPLQTGWNNLMAELLGGLAAAVGPMRTLFASATVPMQVMMEVIGRIANILLRAAGVVMTFASALAQATAIAPAWTALGSIIKDLLVPLESVVDYAQQISDAFSSQLNPTIEESASMLERLIFVVKTFTTVVVSAAVASAVMDTFNIKAGRALATFAAGLLKLNVATVFGGIIKVIKLLTFDVVAFSVKWTAAMIKSGVSAIAGLLAPFMTTVLAVITGNSAMAVAATATGYAMAAAWIIGTLGIAAIIVAIIAVIQNFGTLYDFFADFGNNVGRLFTFEGLAEAAMAVADAIKNAFMAVANSIVGFFGGIVGGIIKAIRGIKTPEKINAATSSVEDVVKSRREQQMAAFETEAAVSGFTGKKPELPTDDYDALASSVSTARDNLVALSLNAANFGEAGRKAFLAARADFDKLQQELANNTLELRVIIDENGVKRSETSLEAFERRSRQIRDRLNENLNLADTISSEQFQQSAEDMRKSVEDAFAQTRSIMRGQDLGSDMSADRFFPASDEIKKAATRVAMDYQDELIRIEKDLQSGKFGSGQKALRAASQAKEDAKAKFDREQSKIDADVSFASDIRKSLEEAFLSPLDKYEKRLKQIQDNKSFNSEAERSLATVMAQRQMVEETFGKTAGRSLREKEEMFAKASAADQYGRTAFVSAEGSFSAGQARQDAERTKLDIERRKAAGLDATPAQQLKAGLDNINDIFGTTGLSLSEIQKKFADAPEKFAEYQEAIKKNRDTVLQSVGVEKSAVQVREESQRRLAGLGLSAEEAAQANRAISDSFMSSIGVTKTPFEQFADEIDNVTDKFGLSGKSIDEVREALKGNKDDLALFDRAVKQSRDNLLQSLGIEKTPQQQFEETMKKIEEAQNASDPNKRITKEQADEARRVATLKRDEALGAGGEAGNFAGQFLADRQKIEEAFGKNGANDPEKFRMAMNKLMQGVPGAEGESPVQKFKDQLSQLEAIRGDIGEGEFKQRRKVLQAQLQEDLKPALDRVAPDRRAIEASDVRSKGGVDTFFRILRGQDNPSLKAQLETAKATKFLAEAAAKPEAAEVIAQL